MRVEYLQEGVPGKFPLEEFEPQIKFKSPYSPLQLEFTVNGQSFFLHNLKQVRIRGQGLSHGQPQPNILVLIILNTTPVANEHRAVGNVPVTKVNLLILGELRFGVSLH